MPAPAPLSIPQLRGIRDAFERRINSLEVDTEKCLSPTTPGIAYFPAVLYAFATLDHFSSYWSGWNKPGPGKDQTARMVDFAKRFLSYGSKEAQVAVNIWRHKLVHTAEPRVLPDAATGERYLWETGPVPAGHMQLVPTGTPGEIRLNFAPKVFCVELRNGVFGPDGYFAQLERSIDLQVKWASCDRELSSYTITIKL